MQTFGQYLVNDVLPADLQVKSNETLTQKDLYKRLHTMALRNPADAAKRIDKLRELGHEIATLEGASISLDDITPNYKERNAILNPFMKQLQKTSDPTKRRELLTQAQAQLLETAKTFHGTQGEAMRAGARGKPVQVLRSFIAPVAARDATGSAVPWMIHHSYSEGLHPSEMWAANYETRNNSVAAYTNITEPGDFSKILVNNMSDQLILSADCGTTNGISMKSDDPNISDRFLAKDADGLKAGALITPQIFTHLHKKVQSVIVRSPMTCMLNDGVCQKCYGLSEKGKLQRLGSNVGIRSAQAISEPLTQFTLSARHGMQRAGAAQQLTGTKGMRQFLDMPKSFTNKATLATVEGKITKITTAPQGGNVVWIGDVQHYVPANLGVTARVGKPVMPGDVLSDGIPMPNEVVQHKGMGEGRKYIVDRLHDLYKGQGIDVDKRHLEILARAQLNHVRVESDPEDRFYPGEVVNYTTVMKRLAEDIEQMDVIHTIGKVLAEPYLHHTAGTVVTPVIAEDLKRHGISKVRIAKHPPKLSAFMQPITSNPLLNPDWMARMGHRELKDTLLEAATYGEVANIHGSHPIPAYAYGAEFGKGKGGKY